MHTNKKQNNAHAILCVPVVFFTNSMFYFYNTVYLALGLGTPGLSGDLWGFSSDSLRLGRHSTILCSSALQGTPGGDSRSLWDWILQGSLGILISASGTPGTKIEEHTEGGGNNGGNKVLFDGCWLHACAFKSALHDKELDNKPVVGQEWHFCLLQSGIARAKLGSRHFKSCTLHIAILESRGRATGATFVAGTEERKHRFGFSFSRQLGSGARPRFPETCQQEIGWMQATCDVGQ